MDAGPLVSIFTLLRQNKSSKLIPEKLSTWLPIVGVRGNVSVDAGGYIKNKACEITVKGEEGENKECNLARFIFNIVACVCDTGGCGHEKTY